MDRAEQPRTYLGGHRVEAKVSPPGAPIALINMTWAAHQTRPAAFMVVLYLAMTSRLTGST